MFVSPENFFTENVSDFAAFKLEKGSVSFGQMKKDVARYASHFAGSKHEDFILYVEGDAVLFATLFFALLQAKKRVMLPSSEKMAEDFSKSENLPVITNKKTLSANLFDIPKDLPECEFDFINMRESRVCFFTSGSTSAPKMIEKNFATLSDETENSASLMGCFEDCAVVSTCEPFHLYGMLWRLLYPMSLKMPAHSITIRDPETLIAIQKQNQKVLFITTPSFIEAVARHRELYDFPQNVAAITTSGGLLKEKACADAKEIWGATPTEIFGSTESGGIASRNRGVSDSWSVFEKVEICIDSRECLRAKSPYALGGEFQTNDIVEIFGGGRKFNFFGRIDRLVKIGETQLNIPDMENAVLAHEFVENCHVDFDGNALRALIVLNSEGRRFFMENGRLKLLSEINSLVKESFDSKFSLRKIKVVNSIPMNAQGKILKGEIKKIFNLKMEEPIICGIKKHDFGADMEIYFAAESAYFNGHFPMAKILPGAIQLHFAINFAKKLFDKTDYPKRVKRLKFSNIIRPREIVLLSIKKGENSCTFSYSKQGLPCSSGVLEF